MKKIAGSMKNSVGIMKDVNMLVKLPEISGAMRELSQELVSAGILEEMVGDSLLDNETFEGEDEEAESEIDTVLGEILKDKVQALGAQVPTEMLAPEVPQLDEEEEIRSEAVLAQMRRRISARLTTPASNYLSLAASAFRSMRMLNNKALGVIDWDTKAGSEPEFAILSARSPWSVTLPSALLRG
ncbi:Vacuolar protein-sorting-associated protein 24 [Elasticomyces elasticus]|nr:Vacuolar protein-sorting-associated protein 24 [Elasticomyces elasticus]KAK3619849.1 Vacuolar protein-sorting-associated protein 24 [Elasticomyces elasticus]KAK4897268.1 Vacuolar protein-sorting-associated protein 24 [Elasticomyces elasticus]KAK5734712.1 Vacuolar protein-sorting-associated protein 24 [Elasticomyces elasticus]